MERNEKGYPSAAHNRGSGEPLEKMLRGNENCDTGGQNCDLAGLAPGYLYAPNQRFCMLYSTAEALSHGTLFEQLYKPVEVYGRE